MKRFVVLIAASLGIASVCHAHEFWIEPSTFRPAPGQSIAVQLNHGERFMGEVVPRDNTAIVRYDSIGSDGASQVLGLDGRSQGQVRIEGEGSHVLVYQSNAYTNTLEAEAFEDYLREEHLESIIEERERRGEREEPGRERYYRCAKSFVISGTQGISSASAEDFLVGLPLEILLLNVDSGTIRARVLRGGVPLAGVRVVAVHRDAPEELFESQTNEAGEVEFVADAPGDWMLTTIHMERVEEDVEADWESFWASSTFGME